MKLVFSLEIDLTVFHLEHFDTRQRNILRDALRKPLKGTLLALIVTLGLISVSLIGYWPFSRKSIRCRLETSLEKVPFANYQLSVGTGSLSTRSTLLGWSAVSDSGTIEKKTHLKRFFLFFPRLLSAIPGGRPPPLSTLWGRGITEVLTDTRPRKREKNTMGATLDSQSEPRRICGVFFSEAHGDVGGLSWRDQHS